MKKKRYGTWWCYDEKEGLCTWWYANVRNPKTGKMVPSFAMDGKGKMNKGGMMKKKGYAKGGSVKKPTMTLAQIRSAAKAKGYKLVKIT